MRERIESSDDLELAAPVPMNVVCFRFKATDDVNRELLLRLQESGIAIVSHTNIDGRFALRAAITNHRTTRDDIDMVLDAVARIGREIR